MGGSNYQNITGAATTIVVPGGPGVLRELCVNSAAMSASVTVYDNNAGSGTKIATLAYAAAINGPYVGLHNIRFQKGLTIVTTGTVDLTVVYD